jgi:hypothetical protein
MIIRTITPVKNFVFWSVMYSMVDPYPCFGSIVSVEGLVEHKESCTAIPGPSIKQLSKNKKDSKCVRGP